MKNKLSVLELAGLVHEFAKRRRAVIAEPDPKKRQLIIDTADEVIDQFKPNASSNDKVTIIQMLYLMMNIVDLGLEE